MTDEEQMLRALMRFRLACGSLLEVCEGVTGFSMVREMAEAGLRNADAAIRAVMKGEPSD